MYLYIVRHAVAHGRDAERWPDDSERPLTPKGEGEFREAAQGLARLVPGVERLLSSPYARAWRTAEILAEVAGWPEPETFAPLEPEIPPEKVALALETFEGTESVALVGHRPCLHELSVYLLTGEVGGADVKIKKGGALCLQFDGPPSPGGGKLRWLLTPRILRAMA